MEQSIDARAGWGQEAREPNKLACQTLDEGNVRKKGYIQKRSSSHYQPSQRSAGHQTSLVPRGGAAWAPDPRDGVAEKWEILPFGRGFDDKIPPKSLDLLGTSKSSETRHLCIAVMTTTADQQAIGV